MMRKLSHCPLASLQAVKEKKLSQSTDKDYMYDNAKAKTMRFFIETDHNLYWIHRKGRTLKLKHIF